MEHRTEFHDAPGETERHRLRSDLMLDEEDPSIGPLDPGRAVRDLMEVPANGRRELEGEHEVFVVCLSIQPPMIRGDFAVACRTHRWPGTVLPSRTPCVTEKQQLRSRHRGLVAEVGNVCGCSKIQSKYIQIAVLDDLSGVAFEDLMEDVYRNSGSENIRQVERTDDEGGEVIKGEDQGLTLHPTVLWNIVNSVI